jgi:hypothetical protein
VTALQPEVVAGWLPADLLLYGELLVCLSGVFLYGFMARQLFANASGLRTVIEAALPVRASRRSQTDWLNRPAGRLAPAMTKPVSSHSWPRMTLRVRLASPAMSPAH